MAGATVDIDGVSPSLSGMTFTGGNYVLGQAGAGGTCNSTTVNGPATLDVAAGSDADRAPVTLAERRPVAPAAGSQLTISGGISGPGGLCLDDQGTVVLPERTATAAHGGFRRHPHRGEFICDSCRQSLAVDRRER